MNGMDPRVVFIGDPNDGAEFAQLDLACRFHGFHLAAFSNPAEDSPPFLDAIQAGPIPILVVIHSSVLAGPPAAGWQALRVWANRHRIPIALVGLTPDCHGEFLAPFIGDVGIHVSPVGADCSLWVLAADAASTGFELRGLALSLGPGRSYHLEYPAGLSVSVRAVAGPSEAGSLPAMLTLDGGEGPRYLLARLNGSGTGSAATWEFRRSHFGEVTPLFLLLREAGGARCWHPPTAMANLTIDDPWLTEPYGCLSFTGLLAEMQRERFHATIGFVPWNYDRSASDVVAIIRANPQYFSIAVHGNNHDRYEFFRYEPRAGDHQRAKPLAEQAFNIRQALARMEAFHQRTGLDFDRVMVFPHGVCPARTFGALKQNGFWATSNYSNVPLGEQPPGDPAVALRAANTEWDAFPALRRNYPQNLSEEAIAIDLFLGNPVLFMAHQDLFFEGIDAFTPSARRVNVRQPAVRWMSLGEISRHLHLLRWLDDTRCDVRLVSCHARVENPRLVPVTFSFTKGESTGETIDRVTIDGVEIPWTFAAGELHCTVSLPAHTVSLIEIHHHFPLNSVPVDVHRRGLRNRCLRLIAEFRDLILPRLPGGRILTRKYYRQGKKRPTISGLFSRLTKLGRSDQ
jgi:peptidoglycan/xylan/chitin deacetylase (PgdA/CDA1 family)